MASRETEGHLVRDLLNVLAGEFQYVVWASFRPLTITVTLLMGAFLLTPLFVGGYALLPAQFRNSPVHAVIAFGIILSTLNGPSRLLDEHRYSGTLEQVYLSPAPLSLLCLYRSVIGSLSYAPLIVAAAFVLRVLPGGDLRFPPLAVVAYVLAFFGMLGIGYLLAALNLNYRETGPIPGLLSLLLAPVTLVDGSQLPWPLLRAIADYAPLSIATSLARGLSLGGLSMTPELSGLIRLSGISTVYLALGLVVFLWSQRQALNNGMLASY